MNPVSKHAEGIARNLAFWRSDAARDLVRADRAASLAVRTGPADREWAPNDRELAQLRAVGKAFSQVPTHAGFVPVHTVPEDSLDHYERGILATGEVRSVGDDTRELLERDPETVTVSDADYENICTRDSTFVFVCKNRAGEVVDDEVKAKGDRAKKELADNGLELALKLQSAGVRAFLPSTAPRASIICPASEQKIDLAPLRRVNFLPPIAKARRDPVVKNLEVYAETRLCRMATFTAGERIPVTGNGETLRARVEFMHRRISKLNAHPLLRTNRVQIQFRATEFGTITLAAPWPRIPGTENGIPWVHLHVHAIWTLEHQLPPRRWRKFLRRVGNLWRFHWAENGALENIREACKYPIKPGDYDHLENAHVAAFYHATRGLHLVQPLGEFREIMRERRDAALKAVRLRNAEKKIQTRFKPDWNARVDRLTTAEKNARTALKQQERRRYLSLFIRAAKLLRARDGLLVSLAKLQKRGTRAEEAARVLMPLRDSFFAGVIRAAAALTDAAQSLIRLAADSAGHRHLVGLRKLKEHDAGERKGPPMRNRICARLAPAAYFDRITRPALLVWNFDGDYSALRKHRFVQDFITATAPAIARAERAVSFLKVHTSHTTVCAFEERELALLDRAEAWHPPPPAVFAS